MTDFGDEVSRTQRLDSELARDLGRGPLERGPGAGSYLAALDRRAGPPAEERALVAAAQDGDATARARLVEAFMPLIASVARTYRSGHVERTELLQEGVVGLLRALEGFDPARGTPFWAYAAWWVRQAMQQLVAELTRPVVLSDRALRQLARLKAAHADAVQEHGREPGRAELAERSGLSGDQVAVLLATERAPRSIDEPVAGDEGVLGTFGDRLGLSGERVRQIEQRALAKLGAERP